MMKAGSAVAAASALRRRAERAVLATAAVVAAAALTAAPAGGARAQPVAGNDWLTGVSAASRTSAWAVGYYVGKKGDPLTLIEHWNGDSWRQVPSPDPGRGLSELDAVTAISAKDAWAVGFDTRGSAGSRCLIERWNGARWATVPAAGPGRTDCQLTAVTAISARDAWAVGSYQHPGPGHQPGAKLSLIEHWNGTAWRQVASPSPGGDSTASVTGLTGVAATSARNAWAVGYYVSDADVSLYRTLIEHWNGSAWATVPSPSPGRPDAGSRLSGVAATSTSAWAVGNAVGPFALRYVRDRWRQVPVPSRNYKIKTLAAVAITSAASAWAVGDDGPRHPWTLRWDGSGWDTKRAPYPPGDTYTELVAVTAPSPAAIWAVGTVGHALTGPVTLIEHWTGAGWVRVPSPNPSP
jgi:hypothetical protein